MKKSAFIDAVSGMMEWNPTQGQREAIQCMADYMAAGEPGGVMLLRGYAGTGKTTLISAFVRFFAQVGVETVLLAPTGRAAKVMSQYAHHVAYTIHKEIYALQNTAEGYRLVLQYNKHRKAVFFVDEASMIDDGGGAEAEGAYGRRRLLHDLFEYVQSGKQCYIVLIGDNAQLPPVNNEYSAALDAQYLAAAYGRRVYEVKLSEVVRQTQESGVLYHATQVRQCMKEERYGLYGFDTLPFPDVKVIGGSEAFELIASAYSSRNKDDVVFITKSNKQANMLNNIIRSRVLYMENELDAGDRVMSVKNSYAWLPDTRVTPFIANGDIMEIMAVRKVEKMYGHRYADVRLRLIDYDVEVIDAKVMLDTLTMEAASLNYKDTMRLYSAIETEYEDIPVKKDRQQAIKDNPYWNAIQIKYAYVQTCHKTQGGQWPNVFVLAWNNTEQMQTAAYYRWLYTAITRSSGQLYIVLQ